MMPAGAGPARREAAEVAGSAGYPAIVAEVPTRAIWPVASPVTRPAIILAGWSGGHEARIAHRREPVVQSGADLGG